MNGLQLTKIIATQHKKVAVLVLSMYDERVYAERALHAGAKGYIMKQEAGKKVILAVRQVLAGNIYLSEEISAWVLHKLVGKAAVPAASPLDALTDRELEVFELIGQGLKPGEISERLHLSVKTIETHREHLKNKLNLANAAELVQHAIAWVHSQQFQ
jgi:DNA-binding NarL/FixJ family response regulator